MPMAFADPGQDDVSSLPPYRKRHGCRGSNLTHAAHKKREQRKSGRHPSMRDIKPDECLAPAVSDRTKRLENKMVGTFFFRQSKGMSGKGWLLGSVFGKRARARR